MLINSIFTTYLQIFINLFMIFLWGWAIIFSLSHVFHHKKMIWGILGSIILWLLTMSEFIISFPKTILILLPNVAFAFQIIDTIEQYWKYIQPYYIQELIITFSILFILVSILKEERNEEQDEVEKAKERIEKVACVDKNPQPIKKKVEYFADANEKTLVAPTVPDFDTERDIKLRSKGKEKPQKVLRAYNTINTIALSPIEQDVTVNASALMREQERKEKEERFRQFSYEADSTINQQIQEAQREIQDIEIKQSQNLFSFSSQHSIEQESKTSSETQQELSAMSEISAIEDTIVQNETTEVKQEDFEDTIIPNETTEVKQEDFEDTIIPNETSEIEDTIIKKEIIEVKQEIEQNNELKSSLDDVSELSSKDYLSAENITAISNNELIEQNNELKSSPDEPSELSSKDYLSAENITAISNNELKVADSLDTLNIEETSKSESPIQLPDAIEKFTPKNTKLTEKNEDSESFSIETIENLAETNNANDHEEAELQTVVEIADFDYEISSDSDSKSDEDSLVTVIETNVKNTTQEPRSLLGALTTHNNDAIKLKKFSK